MRNIFVKLGVSSRVEVARAVERDRREREAAQRLTAASPPPVDPDAARLAELGYRQELSRGCGSSTTPRWASPRSRRSSGSTPSCSSAPSSPGRRGSGCCRSRSPGQCLLLAVYAELASEFPIAGGAYQWSRRLHGRRLRLVQRLGRDLRLRGREHDDRLPRRAVGADPARASSPRPNAIVATGMVLVARLRGRRRARHRRARPGDQGRDRGRGDRVGRDRARAAARLPRRRTSRSSRTRSAPRRSRAARSAPGCSPRSRSAAGSSSASTPASAPRRRRRAPRATCRARSGSRC